MKSLYGFNRNLAVILVVVFGISIVSPTYTVTASTNSVKQQYEETEFLETSRVNVIADEHIVFNEQTNNFIIDDVLADLLTKKQYQAVVNQVEQTNEQISSITANDLYDTNVNIVKPDGTIKALNLGFQTYRYGKNAVSIHWNYTRFYINAGTLRDAMTVGFIIGSAYAPSRAVIIACGIAGYGASKIKHGIWFDYNYAFGVIKAGRQ